MRTYEDFVKEDREMLKEMGELRKIIDSSNMKAEFFTVAAFVSLAIKGGGIIGFIVLLIIAARYKYKAVDADCKLQIIGGVAYCWSTPERKAALEAHRWEEFRKKHPNWGGVENNDNDKKEE